MFADTFQVKSSTRPEVGMRNKSRSDLVQLSKATVMHGDGIISSLYRLLVSANGLLGTYHDSRLKLGDAMEQRLAVLFVDQNAGVYINLDSCCNYY